MLFTLNYAEPMRLGRLHRVFGHFLWKSQRERRFSLSLFPKWFRGYIDHQRRAELRSVFEEMHRGLWKLTPEERRRVFGGFCAMTSIRRVCEDASAPICDGDALPVAIQPAACRLGSYLYDGVL